MEKIEIKTWYDLKRYVVDELDGDQLGQPVVINGLGDKVIGIERDSDNLTLITEQE